jgi:hypothetical protein
VSTIRKYKGYEIRRWSGPYGQHPDSGEPKCYVQTQHSPTGIDWSAEECPKFWSYKAAREWINNQISAQLAAK